MFIKLTIEYKRKNPTDAGHTSEGLRAELVDCPHYCYY